MGKNRRSHQRQKNRNGGGRKIDDASREPDDNEEKKDEERTEIGVVGSSRTGTSGSFNTHHSPPKQNGQRSRRTKGKRNKTSPKLTNNGSSVNRRTTSNTKWRWIRATFWFLVICLLFGIGFIADKMLFPDNAENDTTESKATNGDSNTIATTSTSSLSWNQLVQDTTRDGSMQVASTFQKYFRPSSAGKTRSKLAGDDNNIKKDMSVVGGGSVIDYINLFLVEESNHPFDEFLLQIGEKDINLTSWNPPLIKSFRFDDDSMKDSSHHDSNTMTPLFSSTRDISYMHPVNNPLAPPWARSVKNQHLHIFDINRMAITTTTTVYDVPKADCFTVDDTLLIDLSNRRDDDDGSGVKIMDWSSSFTLKFHKSTMFKSIITRSTTQEYLDHWSSYRDFVLKHGPFLEEDVMLISTKNDDKERRRPTTTTEPMTETESTNHSRRNRGHQARKRRRRNHPHAHTPLPWLSFMVGMDRPLKSFM